jgi:hypothetical protein
MKYCKVPPLLAGALKELRSSLKKDLAEFWPAHDAREIHEGNMVLHLGAILKKNAHIYAEVSTRDHRHGRRDFVALQRDNKWFLICDAKRGYERNHIRGISEDIRRMRSMAKSDIFQEYPKAYGLILITLWTGAGGRALIKAWDNKLTPTNLSPMEKDCRNLVRKLDKMSARRGKLFIQKDEDGIQEHYVLHAVLKINLI